MINVPILHVYAKDKTHHIHKSFGFGSGFDSTVVKLEIWKEDVKLFFIEEWETGWAYVQMDGTYCVTRLNRIQALELALAKMTFFFDE